MGKGRKVGSMCLSATVSFSAAAALAVMGVVLLVRIKNRRYLPLALLPLFFAVQQSAEGFVWLNLANSLAKALFLFFAFIVWPLWIPFALWFVEKNEVRKQALTVCFGVGLVISGLLAFVIPSMTVSATHSSIQYIYPTLFYRGDILFVFYGVATVLPFFLSSLAKTSLFGLLFALSALVTAWIDRTFFISLWCFVSALISLGLFFLLRPQDA